MSEPQVEQAPEVIDDDDGANDGRHRYQPKRPGSPPARDELTTDVKSWLQSLQSGSPLRIFLYRLSPKMFDGHIAEGLVARLDEPMEQDEIKDNFGGGKYELKVHMLQKSGRWDIKDTKRFNIQGPPKIVPKQEAAAMGAAGGFVGNNGQNENPYLARRAIETTEKIAERAQDKADRLEEELRHRNGDGANAGIVELVKEQMRLNSELQNRDGGTTKIFEHYLQSDSDRTAKMRELHDAELRALRQAREDEVRQLRSAAGEDLKRAEDRHDRYMQSVKEQHVRELDNLKSSYEGRIESLKAGFEAQRIALDSEVNRLRSDNEALKKEVAELRTKKEAPLEDQLAKIVTLKDSFEALGLTGEKEEAGVFDKIVETVSPLVEGFAQRVAYGSPEQQANAQQAAAQQQVQQRALAQRQARAQAQAQAQAAGAPKPIDPKMVANMVSFLESCVGNDKSPEEVVQTAQSIGVPRDLMREVAKLDVDQFLAQARVQEGSILQSTAGRSFLRKVMKLIRGE